MTSLASACAASSSASRSSSSSARRASSASGSSSARVSSSQARASSTAAARAVRATARATTWSRAPATSARRRSRSSCNPRPSTALTASRSSSAHVEAEVAERLTDERHRLHALLRGQLIDLRHDVEQMACALRRRQVQLGLLLGQRLVGRHHAQRRVDAAEHVVGHARVVAVDRRDARRVHELQAVREQRMTQQHLHRRDAERVARVARLGREFRQRLERVLLRTLVGEVDEQTLILVVANDRRRGGERQDAYRQDVALEQRVEQRALATLERAQHHDIAASLFEALCARRDVGEHAGRKHAVAVEAQPIQDRASSADAGVGCFETARSVYSPRRLHDRIRRRGHQRPVDRARSEPHRSRPMIAQLSPVRGRQPRGRGAALPHCRAVATDERRVGEVPADDQRWLTPGVRAIGAASLLSDLGHEVPTALLPTFLTATLGAPAARRSA